MVGLSDRLQAIADFIEPGSRIADIGTDHGALPLDLCRRQASPYIVMTDISEDSLSKAIFVGQSYLDTGLLKARVGDGLAPLESGEVDTVVMAGLGGNLMADILSADEAKAKSFAFYILQPRKAVGRLRQYLHDRGYVIVEETLVREGRRICEILKVATDPNEKGLWTGEMGESLAPKTADPDDIRWELPIYYPKMDNLLVREYLEQKLTREERNLMNRQKAKDPDEKAIDQSRRNMDYVQSLLEACP